MFRETGGMLLLLPLILAQCWRLTVATMGGSKFAFLQSFHDWCKESVPKKLLVDSNPDSSLNQQWTKMLRASFRNACWCLLVCFSQVQNVVVSGLRYCIYLIGGFCGHAGTRCTAANHSLYLDGHCRCLAMLFLPLQVMLIPMVWL